MSPASSVVVPTASRRREAPPSTPIVVGVDGSDRSVVALRWAVALGEQTGHPVRAVHVHQVSTVTIAGFDSVAVLPSLLDEDDAEQVLERSIVRAVPDDDDARDRIERVVRTGPLVDRLLEESCGAAVLVVGQRSSMFGQRFLGAARRLVAHAACPVVVVPPGAVPPELDTAGALDALVARAG